MSTELTESLTLLIHGPSKSGKSTTAVTAPAPRLMIDVEGGSRFLNIKPVTWNPMRDAPPEDDGSWDTTVVLLRNYETMQRVYQWVNSGKHPFKSLIIDSISELQAKCLEDIAGRGQVQTQQWGELLRHINGLMRDLRDLTMHPTNPLTAVVLTAMTREGQDGTWRPYLQGQSAVTAPYFWDVTGYLTVEEFQHPDPTQPPYSVRRMYVTPNSRFVAGERVGGRLGAVVEQADLSIVRMIEKVYHPHRTTDNGSE